MTSVPSGRCVCGHRGSFAEAPSSGLSAAEWEGEAAGAPGGQEATNNPNSRAASGGPVARCTVTDRCLRFSLFL